MTAKLACEPAQALVRQCGVDRCHRAADRDLPAQAASTVAPPMLASGYAPIYPAHVPLSELRTKCVGTGPFKLKEYRQAN